MDEHSKLLTKYLESENFSILESFWKLDMFGEDKGKVGQHQQHQETMVTSRYLHVEIELLMQFSFESLYVLCLYSFDSLYALECSDLPEDRSTVLLLGVTRIPTSPTPARRPSSLPLGAIPSFDPIPVTAPRRNSNSIRKELPHRNTSRSSTRKQNKTEASGSKKSPSPVNYIVVRQESADSSGGGSTRTTSGCVSDTVTPTVCKSHDCTPVPIMDRSVDSIGTCSLDVEASAEISDWSEGSSAGTLRSASLPTPSPEPRLPSYLSLACTVNGYSTTTNYDPDRLARSRDTSPHRPNEHAQDNLTFTVHNNLLSPPNLVPLPNRRLNILRAQKDTKNMAEHTTMTHRQEFYSSSKMTYISSESKNFISNLYSSDLVDSCIENGFMSTANKCVTSESNMTVTSNGQSKTISEKVQEYSNGSECKSFIQQRVERLYGPGALAQGFFVMKRQKNKCHETEHQDKSKSGVKTENDKHSKSMNDQLLHDDFMEAGMKQSTSSPTLPVLRHLRPEFRAQLPILASKKGNENGIQKSVTVPTLIDEVKVNGQFDIEKQCVKAVNGSASLNSSVPLNGNLEVCDKIENNFKESQSVVKDGHYFLNVLDKEVQRLLVMAEKAEIELETPDLPEEAKGYLRSASGKARLLVSQKMQQFKGLCTNNLTQVAGEAFPTTNEDLQGFWDMVMLQVDQIDDLYKELDVLRTNNWQEKKYSGNGTANGTSNKPRKIKVNRPVSAVAEENRKQREAQRKKMIEDKRKAMREQTKQPRQSIEIFVPESS